MSFLSVSAYTVFAPNTKAKSAEVNANNAVNVAFFNTITSDILIGSAWQKIASTAASHTITGSDSIRTLFVNVNTSAGYTVFLPTAAGSTHRMLTIKNTGATTGTLTIDGAGSETIDGTTTVALGAQYDSATLHCDGTQWHTLGRSLQATSALSGLVRTFAPRHTARVKTAAGDYTILDTDGFEVFLGTHTSTQTFTLPTPGNNTGRVFLFKKTAGGGSLTVSPSSGTIDGVSSIAIYSQNATVQVVCDGTNFYTTGLMSESGTYTPTLTNGSNVAASTPRACQYLRVGNTVTISGQLDVDPTAAAATGTEIGISLPIASDFANSFQCGGAGSSGDQVSGTAESMRISADSTNNRAAMAWLSQTTSNHTVYFTFTYLIV